MQVAQLNYNTILLYYAFIKSLAYSYKSDIFIEGLFSYTPNKTFILN